MRVLHLVVNYLPLTMGWIYPQINCGLWSSTAGAITRSSDIHYPFPYVSAFTDAWPLFCKEKMRRLLYRFPAAGIFWLKHHFKPGMFDLIHCHFGDFAFWSLAIKKRLRVPMVTMFYGYDATRLPQISPVWKKRYLELFRNGDLFLVEGNHMKRTLIDLGCKEEKIRVFHLGVDVQKIPFKTRKLRQGETLKLLAAGSFREKKGLPYAIEAFARARNECPGMTLSIIGDSSGARWEEEEKRKIMGTVMRNNLRNYVKFLGFLPRIRFIEEMQKHHLFISPSVTGSDGDTEGGSPVAITEASASGMPVISTWHCDIPEVVIHNKTGLLSEEKDVANLSESISIFIKNTDALIKFGRMGRTHIETEYNITKQVLKLKDIYKSLLN